MKQDNQVEIFLLTQKIYQGFPVTRKLTISLQPTFKPGVTQKEQDE